MIDDYLTKLPEERQTVIIKLQELTKQHLPKVEESLHYKMPTYRINGKDVIAFAAQKHYFSVYIMDIRLIEKYTDDFSHLNIGKSCIRFKRLSQFPLQSFEMILKEISNRY